MVMSYTTLVGDKDVTGSIKSWQNYAKVDAEGVLEDAQAMIFQSLRVREMRSSQPFTVQVGDSYVALPTGFLDPIQVRNISQDCGLELVGEDEMEAGRSYSNGVLTGGYPYRYAIYDERFQFESMTDVAWTGRATFFKRPTALGPNNTTNFLTTRYPHILRAMCLAMAAEFSHNSEDYNRNLQRAVSMIADLNIMDDLSRRGQQTDAEGA